MLVYVKQGGGEITWKKSSLKERGDKRLRRFEGDKKTAARLPLIKLPWQLHTKIEEGKL